MILSKTEIIADTKKRQEILEILFSLKLQTQGEPGCLSCCITQELENEKLITYETLWQTEQSLYNHIRSSQYRNLLAAIDLSSEAPDVRFYTVSRNEGMELVKKVLGYAERERLSRKPEA